MQVPPDKAGMYRRCQAAVACACARPSVAPAGPPPLHPLPLGVQEVEGAAPGEVGGLYPAL